MTGSTRSPRAGVVTLLAGLSVFLVVAVTTATGLTTTLDAAVHDLVVDARLGWLGPVMLAVSTAFGIPVVPVVVLVVALAFWIRGHRWSAVAFQVAMIATIALSTGIKYLFARERPDPTRWMGQGEHTPAFPSSHTVCAAVLVLVAGYLWWRLDPSRGRRRRWLVVAVLVTGVVAYSRLYLGVHWLTDTIAAMGLACVVTGTVMTIDARRSPRPARLTEGTRPAERPSPPRPR